MQSSADAIVGTSKEGIVIGWNKGAERLYGYTAAEAVGQHISFILVNADSQYISELTATVLRGERLEALETVRRHKDGRLIDVSVTVSPVFDDEGNVIGAASIARDITKHKQAERALRRREFEYRALTEQFPGGAVYLFDHDLRFLIAGGEGLTRVGLSREQVEGKTVYQVIGPEHLQDLVTFYQAALTGNTTVAERQYVGRIYRLTASPVCDESGDIVAGLMVAFDITDQKLAQDRLRHSEAQFRLMFERNPLPTWVRDQRTDVFVEVNTAAIQHYGYTREEFLSMSIQQIFPPESREEIIRQMAQLRAEQDPNLPRVYEDHEHQLKSGEIRHVRVVAQDLIFANRECTIAIVADITEARQHEQALVQLAASQTMLLQQLITAEEAERRRLAMEIHDGPLQSLGVAAMGLDRAMRRRARGEDTLADQETSLVRHTLREIADEIRGTLADLSQETLVKHGLAVALHAHSERLGRLTGMRVHFHNRLQLALGQPAEVLLYRLAQEALSNIRKHAHARDAYVHLKSDVHHVVLQVADNGKGFDVDRARQQYQDGKGLGLRSMRERIEAVGGKMEIYSAAGEGTILTFRYPLADLQTTANLSALLHLVDG